MRYLTSWIVGIIVFTSIASAQADALSDAAARNRQVDALFASGNMYAAYTLGQKVLAENRSATNWA
jgi:hypothetical protein